MTCLENPRVNDINLVMIFIVIKGAQVFTCEALWVLIIQKSVHTWVKLSG